MAKIAEKTSAAFENVEFPTFDTTKAVDQIRSFAEKGVEQSKEAYAKMKSGAEETQKALESTLETAKAVSSDMSLKAVAAMRANADTTFSHIEALIGVKSISELIELQTAFVRKSFETTVEQGKAFQASANKAVEELSRPVKTAFEKGVREIKAA